MPKIWPHAKIRELLVQAKLSGEARAQLDTRQDAERFRYAIYAFRRNNNIGYDVSVTIEDTTVVVTKKQISTVTLLSETANAL